jgi:hypothetical protein
LGRRYLVTRLRVAKIDRGENEWNGPVPMPEQITKLNIEHFRKLLQTEADAKRRAVIERLLAEEEAKLASLKKRRSERKAD